MDSSVSPTQGDQEDTAVMPEISQRCHSAPVPCPGLQSEQSHAGAGLTEGCGVAAGGREHGSPTTLREVLRRVVGLRLGFASTRADEGESEINRWERRARMLDRRPNPREKSCSSLQVWPISTGSRSELPNRARFHYHRDGTSRYPGRIGYRGLCDGPDMPRCAEWVLENSRALVNLAVSSLRAVCHVFGKRTVAERSPIRHLARLVKSLKITYPDTLWKHPEFESPWKPRLHDAPGSAGLDPVLRFPPADAPLLDLPASRRYGGVC